MDCTSRLTIKGPACPDSFTIKGVTETSLFRWFLAGKFDTVYNGEASSTAEGELIIPVNVGAGLRKDLFQSFSGSWLLRLEIFAEEKWSEYLLFTKYNSVELIFQKLVPVPDPNNYLIVLP